MDLAAIIRLSHRFNTVQLVILPLIFILCWANAFTFVNSSPSYVQMGNRNEVMSPSRVHADEYKYDDYEEETSKEEPSIYVDACESEQEFVKMATGINPESRLVQLHPSTYVYTTRCRSHRAGKSCSGLDDVESVCRPKSSWVQVYGRVLGEQGSWQPQWVAVDTSCSCFVKTPISSLKNKNKYSK